jgi:hypothetical protein
MAIDKKLAAALERDDQLEDAGELHGDARATCHTHQAWAADCAHRHPQVTAEGLLAEAQALERARQR